MKQSVLRSVRPLVREYSSTRGGERQGLGGNAVVGIIHKKPNGPVINRINYSSCYGSLYNYGENAYSGDFCNDEIMGILLQVQPKPPAVNEDAYRHYIEWVLNYSPWRHAFVSKSVSKVLKDGVVLVDPEQTSDYMMSAMIGFRQCWENFNSNNQHKRINLWWDVAQHVNPTIAFTTTHLFLMEKTDNSIILGPVGGHSSLNPSQASNENLLSFIKGEKKDRSRSFKESKSYNKYSGGLASIWKGVKKGPTITSFVDETLRSTIAGKVKVNPFANKDSLSYSKPAVVEAFVASIPELEREIYA